MSEEVDEDEKLRLLSVMITVGIWLVWFISLGYVQTLNDMVGSAKAEQRVREVVEIRLRL